MSKQTITRDTWSRFGLPAPATEVRVCDDRLFRVDFVWYCQCAKGCDDRQRVALAVEVHGGTWMSGRHSRGTAQAADMVKGQRCALRGWHRMEFTPQQVTSGYGPAVVAAWLRGDANPVLPPDPEDRRKGRKAPRVCAGENNAGKAARTRDSVVRGRTAG